LIPLTGIFEHREVKGWKKKVPYHVRLKDRKMFCVPGLYDEPNKHSGGLYTFTLLTREANSLMRLIHNAGGDAFRMPLFLTKELELLWLKEGLTDAEMKAIFDYEMPPQHMEYDTVYTIRTNKERPDGKGKLEHYTWENLPPLGRDTNAIQLF
jgi:putative SOS response-associated peptidase YedK